MTPPFFQTVTAVNYLPITLVMARTLKQQLPEARLCILVSDVSRAALETIRVKLRDVGEFLCCDDLQFDGLAAMREYYSPLEYNSACKILALRHQLLTCGEKECIFIDPDMYVLGDIVTPMRALDKDIVVTHHARAPYPDDNILPNEMEIAVSGAVNGGLVYMRQSARVKAALEWMSGKIPAQWFVAPAYGMYGDQQWLSFLPQFFRDVTGILPVAGINVAYWNLHERPLRETQGRFMVHAPTAEPLLLFHFSGFPQHDGSALTKYQRRMFDPQTEDALKRLIHDYWTMLQPEQKRMAAAGIVPDLSFSALTLGARLKAASRRYKRRYVPVAPPASAFARLGAFLDRLAGHG